MHARYMHAIYVHYHLILLYMCPHTSAYVSIRQHTSAYVSIYVHYHLILLYMCPHTALYVIRQHTSAYVSIRQRMHICALSPHTTVHVSSAYVSIRASIRVSIRISIRVSIRQHTSAYVSNITDLYRIITSYYCTCVLILLCMCPHTIYCTCVLILLCMCPHTICVLKPECMRRELESNCRMLTYAEVC
jgi:hypothetical protein